MQRMVVVTVLLPLLWIAVLASLLGLIDVALFRYEDRSTRLLELAIATLIVAVAFGLAPFLTPTLTTDAYQSPISFL